MSERLPIEKSELEDPSEVFKTIATYRSVAQEHRAAYREFLKSMDEECQNLRGVELQITGRLTGREGRSVSRDDPDSLVERLHVRVGSAQVETYELHGDLITQHLPFISIVAWTVEKNEMICAWLGVGEFGVTAEVVQSTPIQI